MNANSTFKSGLHCFIAKLPNGEERTWIGGETQPGRPEHVWLCHGNGQHVLELPEKSVKELTKRELARRIADEITKTRGRN